MTEIEDAGDLLHHAHLIVTGERQETHGDKHQTFAKIAAVWNGILIAAGAEPKRPLDGEDVANLMAGMKMARSYSGKFHDDDWLDQVGYVSISYELRLRKEGK